MRAAIYTRVSKEEGTQPGLSLPMQAETCSRLAASKGAASTETFTDAGFSGTTLKRPALQCLLSRLSEFDALIVYRLDRLCRNLRDRLALLDACMEAGVSVHSATEHIELDTIMGRAMVQMLAVFSEIEIATLRERVRDALAHRVRVQGLSHGRPPYGYACTSHGEPIAPQPDQAPIVIEMFHRFAAGASLATLAQDLNRRKIPCYQGGARWWSNAIGRMLRRRTYLGEVRSGKDWLPGKHVPLVSRDLFRRCERRLSVLPLGAPTRRATLASVLRCAYCQGPMTKGGYGKRKKNPPRYGCKHRTQVAQEERHPPNSVSAPKANAALWAYVEWLLTTGDFREGLEAYLRRLTQAKASGEMGKVKERLAALDRELALAFRGYRLGRLPEALYLAEVEPLNRERERLQARLDAAQVPADLRETAAYLRRISPATYLANLRKQPVEIQVGFLARLFERVEVRGNMLTFLHRGERPSWTMSLPPRWERGREVGFFRLPDGSQVSGRTPRR